MKIIKRKNKIIYSLMLMAVFILVPLPTFSQTSDPAQTSDPVTIAAKDLQARLQLKEEQMGMVIKIFKMAQSQAVMDRENFKGNALALIQAAMRRRDMTDGLVDGLLTPEQKPIFADFKENRKRSDEFFILNEGLILSEEQNHLVKQILDEYQEMLKSEDETITALAEDNNVDMMNDPYGSMPGIADGIPGSVPGGMPGSVPGTMRRGLSGGMRSDIPGELRGVNQESRLLEAMKNQDAKKQEKIDKVLTEEQKKMYRDIIKMQEQELKKKLEERRQK